MTCRLASCALLHLGLLLILVMTFSNLPVTVHADALPDLTVDSLWLEDASQPGQPITQLSLGQSFNIVATLKNLGQATASGYYIDVYYDSDYGRGGPDQILAGETQTWYVGPLTAQNGTHTTKWAVDPDNLIVELDESNNLKEYTFTIGQQTTTTTSTTSNSTSTTTEPATTTVQTMQFLTSTGTTNVASYTTTTATSYTGTSTLTSTIVVPTTVTVGPSTLTSTLQTTRVLTATGTTTVVSYTTVRVTSYTATITSISTRVVSTTVTGSGPGSTASSPLAYVGFLSLFAVAFGQGVTANESGRIQRSRSRTSRGRCLSN